MPTGLLEVTGRLDLGQFWPKGKSDADTAHVVLDGPDPFRFRPHPGAPFTVTHAFEDAVVKGNGNKPPINAKNKSITVRFQGIDAPELHYRPQHDRKLKLADRIKALFKKFNKEYRQFQGETCVYSLAQHIGADGVVACKVVTRVDHPNDVFDTYGRFIGDIVLDRGQLNINEWLLERGYALPTFYNSMDADEIERLTDIADGARKARLGVWGKGLFTQSTPNFNPALVYEKGPFKASADRGACIVPKLFRRQTNWFACSNAGIVKGGFFNFLKQGKDLCAETNDFLAHGATAANYEAFWNFVSPQLKLDVRPYDLVFKEEPSKLVGPGGKIPNW